MSLSRRKFLAVAALAGLGSRKMTQAAKASSGHKICVFTKPFQTLTYTQLAERIAAIGFDGIEAPIRDGGHIEPAAVEDELPKMVEALKTHGLEITVMTSSVNDVRDPLTERVLRTAAGLGVKRYRMKYFKYDMSKPVAKQLKEWRPMFRDLAAMNKEFGITGMYQNHSGVNYLGASLWDLLEVLDGINPAHIGVAYDIRHATVEGGTSWPLTFRAILPHLATVYFKDFEWGDKKPANVPLGEGRVDGPGFVNLLRKAKYNGPISLHEEYLSHKNPSLVPQHLEAMEKDLKVLRGWLDG